MNSYYPFGLTFNSYQRVTAKQNRFLYNDGTERIEDLNLGVDFTDFRVYDPAVARWWHIDTIEKFHESPYAWVTNNPILYNDPLGLDTTHVNNIDPATIDYENDVTITDEVVISASREPADSGIPVSQLQPIMEVGKPYPYRGKDYYDYHQELAGLNVQMYTAFVVALLDPREDYDATIEKQYASNTQILRRLLKALKAARTVERKAKILRAFYRNKNTIKIKGVTQHMLCDVAGPAHKGIKTPHVQRMLRNVSEKGVYFNKDGDWVRHMTHEDIRIIVNFIEKSLK